MTWLAVGTTAASAAVGIYGSKKASDQQADAQKQNIAAQKEALQYGMPYMNTGSAANNELAAYLGLGYNDSYEDLVKQYAKDFTTYRKIDSGGGGLGGALKKAVGGIAGITGLTGIAGLSGGLDSLGTGLSTSGLTKTAMDAISKSLNKRGYSAKVDSAKLNEFIAKKMAEQKAVRESDKFGSLMRNFSNADFVKDPGYDWRMKQGEDTLNRSLSARGKIFSGQAGKELLRYGQGFASNEFGAASDRFNQNKLNTYNMLSGVAGRGQSAAAGQANQMNSIGDAYATAGANRAAGTMGMANALTGAIGQGTNYWQQQQLLNKLG